MDRIGTHRSTGEVSRVRRSGRALAGAAALVVAVVVAGLNSGSASAGGGGPYLVPDAQAAVFQAGDRVHLHAANIYKTDRAWHGPYTVYLRPDRPDAGLAGLAPAGAGANDVEVGNLDVNRVDDVTVTADITFTMPKLANGTYFVMTCNATCANPLGQLVDSSINVGSVPLPTVPSTVAFVAPTTVPPVTAQVASVSTNVRPIAAPESTTIEVGVPTTNWVPVGVAFGIGVALTWLVRGLLARRRWTRPGFRPADRGRSSEAGTVDSSFIPMDAVHEETLV